MPESTPSADQGRAWYGASLQRCAGAVATLVLMLGASTCRAVAAYDVRNYFPLQAHSVWTLEDIDGEPADDEGYSWTVSGTGPQSVGTHSAWRIDTSTRNATDSRAGDAQFWNLYNGQADVGLYGVYEKAGASPLSADQTIAFSQPLRFGTEHMAVGWSATSAATASFRVTLPFFGTMAVPGNVASTVTLVSHLDQLSTPLGLFYDVLVVTADVSGSASYLGFQVFQGTLFQGTLFLARGVGLVRSTRNLDMASVQAQAISTGQLGGVPIVPPPPPVAQGLTITADGTETGEDGSSIEVTVVLDAAPTASVTVILACDDPSEARLGAGVSSLELGFSQTDWNVPQHVLVRGVDDAEWDGPQTYHVTFALRTTDPGYAELDPSRWTLTLTNRDNEALDIGDYFVLVPGSLWRYEAFNEESGPYIPPGSELTWTVEDEQPVLHGVPTTAIRADADDVPSPLNGTANLWSLDPAGSLLLHGVRLPVGFERDVDYLGGTYHLVVPPQTIEFAVPLLSGTRGMVAHLPVSSATTANVQVSGLPLISALPVNVASRCELLGMRERKRTPLGAFTHVPVLSLTLSIDAMGESVQNQGGILFLAKNIGVICQNAAAEPESADGMALLGGRVGDTAIVADDPTDRVLRFALALYSGWNLVALPCRPLDPAPAAVFGDAIAGPAWEQRGLAYAIATALRAGEAYWVYRNPLAAAADAPLEVQFSGTPETATTRVARPGWFRGGVISEDASARLRLPMAAAAGGTPLCRVAWVWGPGGFQAVREVAVGAGVWFSIETAGVIDLAPGAAGP